MKTPLISLLLLLLLAFTACQETIDIEAEKQAIIALVEEETAAYVDRDYDRWAATYVQDETNLRLAASADTFTYIRGWNELGEIFKKGMETYPDTLQYSYEKTDYLVKIYKDAAWVYCHEKISSLAGDGGPWTDEQVRFLEKVDGQWKIVFLSYVLTSSYEKSAETTETED